MWKQWVLGLSPKLQDLNRSFEYLQFLVVIGDTNSKEKLLLEVPKTPLQKDPVEPNERPIVKVVCIGL